MPREVFQYPETKAVFDLVEQTARRSGVSRAQAIEDFLQAGVCALSNQRMEDEYLAVIARHAEGEKGKRGADSIAHAFGTLIEAMERTRKDILGDLFQGAITYGEAGQFLTPEPVCTLMARMTVPEDADRKERRVVSDPCCGSGRLLLAAADINPHWEFIGQDVDLRCVRMTVLNLALYNRHGYVIWGNSLTLEQKLVYRTGFDGLGFVSQVPPEACPSPVQQVAQETGEETRAALSDGDSPDVSRASQLRLF